MRRCRTCGEEKHWREFQRQRNQVRNDICATCRHKQEQMQKNNGLDISTYMKRWGR